MAPRKRKKDRDGWPDNLYCRDDGYFSWRNPQTGREFGLGRIPQRKAFQEAMKANAHISKAQPSLIERLTGEGELLGPMLDRFEQQIEKRDHAENTRKVNKSRAKRTRAMFGEGTPIRSITTEVVATALDAIQDEGKARLAQSMRSYWFDFFRFCIAKGKIERNPVEVTERITVKVKRARLVFDVFMQVYQRTEIVWLKNAMALALVSAQRREEISSVTVPDIRDGAWWCEQGKTGSRVAIPLTLRLDCFGMSLADVVKQCRSTGVLSKYLVHQTERRGNSPVGSQIWIDTISRRFTDELAKLGLDWGENEAPTFHEIRSLSERLYSAQGNVNTQELLGHKDPRMTAVYHDSRGAEWVKVSIG